MTMMMMKVNYLLHRPRHHLLRLMMMMMTKVNYLLRLLLLLMMMILHYLQLPLHYHLNRHHLLHQYQAKKNLNHLKRKNKEFKSLIFI